ncbi:hypothetical protein [Propylenella binzhouense]|uniref:Uncharacterized protein n=1 Tax=Propylenella binzhouense TaxID=2555902 RepID=A0A964WTH8_9HYPH|nr:hypothetical protein [Propylenella binzhouense]MYZ47991.1 hypothetical protein [Propylenella binzhouense]
MRRTAGWGALALFGLATLAVAPAPRAGAQESSAEGRYATVPAPEGAWRVDRSTGAVELCSGSGPGASCRLLPNERNALFDEIDRLNGRIDRLEARLSDLEAARGLQTPQAPPPAAAAPRGPDMPTEDELDKALDFTERAFRRMLDMMQRLKRDYGDGGSAPPDQL